MTTTKKNKIFPVVNYDDDGSVDVAAMDESYSDVIILADKPKEWSSNGVLNVLKKAWHKKSGTLRNTRPDGYGTPRYMHRQNDEKDFRLHRL